MKGKSPKINRHLTDLMNPIVDQLIKYLKNYKEDIDHKTSKNIEENRKIENMWNYIINDLNLDIIYSSNRQDEKGTETIYQRIKRSINNF